MVNPKEQPSKTRRRKAATRERQIDAFTSYVKAGMAEGVYNTRQVYRERRERGYTGGLTAVILSVQPHRPEHAESAGMRFETEPGQQAQVEWGDLGRIEYEGRSRKLYAYGMTLS